MGSRVESSNVPLSHNKSFIFLRQDLATRYKMLDEVLPKYMINVRKVDKLDLEDFHKTFFVCHIRSKLLSFFSANKMIVSQFLF